VLSLGACVTGGLAGPDVDGTGSVSAGAGVSSAGAPGVTAGSTSSVAGMPATSAGGASVASGGASVTSGGAPTSAGGSAPMEQCNYPAWVAMKPYVTGDKVVYLGKGYVATGDNPGYDPTVSTFFWSPLPCTPVVVAAGGSTGSGGGSTTGSGGAGSTNSCARLDKLLPMGETTFNAMFQPPWAGHVAKALYSYSGLCTAMNSMQAFGAFANSGDLTKDRIEIAAFFAHVAKETAFLEQTDESGQPSNASDFHGRGAIQITGQSNYAAAGSYLGKNLTGDPGLVSTDPVTNWQSALWFWMVNNNPGTAGVQNCHQAIMSGDFAQTTRIINGGIECPGSQSAQQRATYFKNDCALINVTPGNSLVC
jgi:predicted chitinase